VERDEGITSRLGVIPLPQTNHMYDMKTKVYGAIATILLGALACGEEIPQSAKSDFEKSLEYVGIAVSEPGYHVWGCSPVIGPEGKTHLFSARWPTSTGFRPGWFTSCEIAHYVADKPEGPFKFVGVVLKGTGNREDWDCRAPHNPTIQKIGDRYALLYIGNNGTSKGSTGWQRTGMVVSDSLYGPWKKVGKKGLIIEPPADRSFWNYSRNTMINNPALLKRPDGRFAIYFKSTDTRPAVKGAARGRMGVAFSDKLEGPYVIKKDPITPHPGMHEDGYAFMQDGKVFFLSTGNLHLGGNKKTKGGYGLLWEFKDGVTIEKEPLLGFDRPNVYMKRKGVKPGKTRHYRGIWNFQRPQILMQDGRPAYLFAPSGSNIYSEDDSGSVCYVLKCNWDKAKQSELPKQESKPRDK